MLTKPQIDLLGEHGDDIQQVLEALIDANYEIESLHARVETLEKALNEHVCEV